jgi:hypothetical protein
VTLRAPAWLFVAAALLLMAGCGPSKQSPVAKEPPKTPADKSAFKPSASSPDSGPSLDLSELPEELRNDAFAYYGLGRKGVMKQMVTISGQSEAQEGTMASRLTLVHGGEAFFAMDVTGPLARNGQQELVLRKEGLFATKLGNNVLDPPQVELPSPLKPGVTWQTELKVTTADGQSVADKTTYRVAGVEKVKVKAGEFEALRIKGQGTSSIDGKSYDVTLDVWYVRDVGPVKVSFVASRPNEKKQTLAIEAVELGNGD